MVAPRFAAHRRMMLACAALALAAAPCRAVAASPDTDGLGQVLSLPLRKPFGTRADWHVTAWQAPDEEGRYGELPARICFNRGAAGPPQDCVALMRAATNDTSRQVFQTVTGLSVTRLVRTPVAVNAVLAQAEMSYGGSGSMTQYAVWSYRKGIDAFEPLATFQITEQGELQVIDDGKLAGCIVTAEYLMGAGETHFGEHRFAISVHQLNPATMTYTEILRYVTATKYPSLDEGGVEVIRPEMAATLRILRFVYPGRF